MSGDEQKIFYSTMRFLVEDKPKLAERNNAFMVYKMIIGRDWSYDYYSWYLPTLDEKYSHDSRIQGQSEGKETT